jgi:predicted transposase YdaD
MYIISEIGHGKQYLEYRKPYQTRHTFISQQKANGVEDTQITNWVGTSLKMLHEHYAGTRVRVYRRYPDKEMRQVVIYLQPTGSERVRQTSFALERTRHEFDVICLWEQPANFFLQYPGLLPFAALGQTNDPEATLRQVAQTVDQISDLITQANLTAASAILAGIVLKEDVIYRLLRRDIMQESSVYRSILAEGEGRKQREIAINLLRRGVALDIIAPSTGLSIEEVQQLQQQIAESSQT